MYESKLFHDHCHYGVIAAAIANAFRGSESSTIRVENIFPDVVEYLERFGVETKSELPLLSKDDLKSWLAQQKFERVARASN
ncbi:MAG: hypothetical protein KatS3mg015_3013 [Fimbriimonadales bacterium]|nr:MAG: hypothetical protein KatS3mg015_3013 [Fimbriimonadales bacterium]